MAKMTERTRAMKINGTLMIIGLLFNMGALLLLWVDGARTPYVEKEFSYSADVLTRNSYYDTKTNKFLDTRYSTAQFQLDTSTDQKTIKRSYTQGEGDVISSRRTIDAKTGQYTDSKSTGAEYVFAPRDVNESSKFYFSPLESGNAVELRYDKKDTLQNLTVYHFKGERHVITRDTTASLQDNESVSSKVVYDVWIEPTSGWLVKYKSATDTNIINTSTNEVVRPLDRLSTITTPQSVDQHTTYAETLRSKRIFILQVGPSLFVIAAIILIAGVVMVRTSRTKTIPVTIGITSGLVITCITVIGWLAGIGAFVTFFVGNVAINPLVSICFAILIGGMFAKYRNKPQYMVLAGAVVFVVAALQLLGSLGVTSFVLDRLLFGSFVQTSQTTMVSMMSPYVSLALLIFSTIFVSRGLRRHPSLKYLQSAVAVTIMFGLLGVIFNVTRINSALAIPFAWSLSFPESILLIVAALTALQLFYRSVAIPEDIKYTLWSLRWASLAALPLLIIGIFAQMQQYGVSRDLTAVFDKQIASINTGLGVRFQLYTQALYGARGLILSSEQVTNDEWRDYNNAYRATDPLEGMEAIGYAAVGNDSAILEHVEPTNKSVPGELYEEAGIRETVVRAVTTGQVAVSAAVPAPTPNDIRTYIMVPVYAKDSSVGTVADREKNIEGVVFGVMSFPKVTHSSTDGISPDVGFEIYAGSEINDEPLFRRYEPSSTEVARMAKQQSLYTSGQAFTVVYHALPSMRLSTLQEYSASAILLGGGIVYWGFLAMTYILIDMNQLRSRKRLENMTRDR